MHPGAGGAAQMQRRLVSPSPSPVSTRNDYSHQDFDVKKYMKLDAEKHFFLVTTVASVEGHDKVLRYDLKKLLSYGAIPTIFCTGTVFTMSKHALVNLLGMSSLAALVCGITVLAHAGDLAAMAEFDTKSIQELSDQINKMVPFVLGLYLALSLKRWWDFRVKGLGKIFEQMTSVIMLVAVELAEPRWQTVRVTVAKFGLASIDLIVQAARRREDLGRLVEQDLINDYQRQALANLRDPWERPMVCWAWIMRISLAAMDYNRTPAPRASFLMTRCLSAKDGMLMLNTYRETPLPFGYVHLITTLVNVQNIVMALSTGILVAQACVEIRVFVMVQHIFALTVVVSLYQGILLIAYVIADPFGDDILNFPMTGFMNHVMSTVDSVFTAHQDCPIVADNGVLHHPADEGFSDYGHGGYGSYAKAFGDM